MAHSNRAENNKYTSVRSNPNHPDLTDPYRDIRKLFRTMKPEEEDQKPYDFGNVNQAQLAVDGYASKVEAVFYPKSRPNPRIRKQKYFYKEEVPKSGHSKSTRPEGIPAEFPTTVKP